MRPSAYAARFALAAACLIVPVAGCDACDVTVIDEIGNPDEQIDTFTQKAAAQVDILWVVDNSESMFAEQIKVASRFSAFFNQLITSQVDYHIGVVTTDGAENGVLRQYQGPAINGCPNCRFITNQVSCANPEVDVSGLTTEAEIEQRLQTECEAQLVFRKLIQVGINGTSFEEGFKQASVALGARELDAVGFPTGVVPAENAGFIRPGASLYIIFVSDEEEGGKREGDPVRYYARLFEGLKGAGNENKVAVAAITGYPTDDDSLPPISEVCGILQTTFDANPGNDDARAGVVREALRTFENTCRDQEAEPDEPNAQAETGGRYIETACRTGGVVANMCESDYSVALDALGANAAGLLRKFTISLPLCMQKGEDGVFGTEDDARYLLDCNGNGQKDDPEDGLICVVGRGIDEAEGTEKLIPQSETEGWQFEEATSSVTFRGRFTPGPNSTVAISYGVNRTIDGCGR